MYIDERIFNEIVYVEEENFEDFNGDYSDQYCDLLELLEAEPEDGGYVEIARINVDGLLLKALWEWHNYIGGANLSLYDLRGKLANNVDGVGTHLGNYIYYAPSGQGRAKDLLGGEAYDEEALIDFIEFINRN